MKNTVLGEPVIVDGELVGHQPALPIDGLPHIDTVRVPANEHSRSENDDMTTAAAVINPILDHPHTADDILSALNQAGYALLPPQVEAPPPWMPTTPAAHRSVTRAAALYRKSGDKRAVAKAMKKGTRQVERYLAAAVALNLLPAQEDEG